MEDDICPEFAPAKYKNFRPRVKIDSLRLGEEVMEIANDIMEVGELTAGAIAMRDTSSNDLKIVTARAADELRQEPNEGTGKPKSEAHITAELPRHKRVKEAIKNLEQCKYDAELWMSLMNSFRTKQSSLKILAEMTMAGYLTASASYGQRKEEMKEARKARVKERS